ncbi:glycosyltransferase family 4 protein|uniref:glycosyltransferase n=1 Tax=Noviherbaspirillum sp. L7-7A TaxID=2850560 RepID=UPI001C2BD5A1|nr:glycosyltransferase family 4 protein [Noviherbaspirillum sp. L7-7A]MBV0879106.1 glycosyltransferase family 4 protein [Noviherbaspirillum sp. L7-7A]
MTRKKLLILTQTLPALGGQGTAMRLGNMLEALARHFDITMICVSVDRPTHPEILAERWKQLCSRAIFFNVADEGEPLRQRQRNTLTRLMNPHPKLLSTWPVEHIMSRLSQFRSEHFDAVLVSRIRLMPLWRAMQAQLGVRADRRILDLDDIESRSQALQVNMLGVSHLGRMGYVLEWLEAKKLAREEARAFSEMEQVLLCSPEDKALLAQRFSERQIGVIPNTIRVPAQLPARQPRAPLQLLFVGTLNYPPNENAVKWLTEEIIPAIRKQVGPDNAVLTVIGRGPTEWMKQQAAAGAFVLHGDVPDVAPYYEACDAVLVPIRAGGGTRIKILEAFGYGRVVISTTLGAEGIAAGYGSELLIANSPDEFAEASGRLLQEPELAQRLIAHGRRRVMERYSMGACEEAVDAIFLPTMAGQAPTGLQEAQATPTS